MYIYVRPRCRGVRPVGRAAALGSLLYDIILYYSILYYTIKYTVLYCIS